MATAPNYTKDEEDRVFRSAKASFVGNQESADQDDGVGYWGLNYRTMQTADDFPGFGLPLSVVTAFKLDENHPIRVYSDEKDVEVWGYLIDIVPETRTGTDITCLQGVWAALGYPTSGENVPDHITLDIRIVGVVDD